MGEAQTYESPARSREPRRGSGHRTRTRLRQVYFSIAAIWGFSVGTLAILGCLSLRERALTFDAFVGGLVAGGAIVAAAGGLIAAKAYHREAGRRS